MSNHTTCYICNDKVSFPGKNKHLFSKKHGDDIKAAISKKKGEFMTWIGNVSKGVKKPTPLIRFNGKPFQICLVCKKISPNSDSYVNCPCGKNAENAQAIMDILETFKDTETSTEDNSELQAENNELKAEIEKLKATNQKLTSQNKKLQGEVFDAQEPYDCLYHILSHYQEKDTEMFNNVLSLLKGDSYSTTYSKIKEELYLDE